MAAPREAHSGERRRVMSAAEATMTSNVSLTAPAKPEYLACFRLVLVGLARAGEIDEETLSDLKLAVTEACSNSVRHAYGEAGSGNVTGRFELGEDYLAIQIEDDGAGFEVDATEKPSFPPPGFGLSIIQTLTDDFQVSKGTDGRGSRVSFRKAI
jgi:serine/threonine-protein kinase RsbW